MEFLETLKKGLEDGSISEGLNMLGKVASAFNPVLGGGIMMASNITDQLKEVPDDFLEKDVIGLNGSAQRLDKMIADKQVDFDVLALVSDNLKSMSAFMQKSSKLIG